MSKCLIASLVAVWILAAQVAKADSQFGDFFYTNDATSVTITGQATTNQVLTIPPLINGMPVVNIRSNAFFDSAISSVTLPDTVTNIGDYAFASTPFVTNFVFGTNISTIGNFAFENCGLKSFPVGNLTSIGNGAFNFSKITNAILPDSLTNLGGGALAVCSFLTNVIIGSNITSLGDGAFVGTGIISMVVPATITNLGSGVFDQCSKLIRVSLPDALTGVFGDNMFFQCSNLTSVNIPNGITSIGVQAFLNCAITNLILSVNVTNIGSNAFGGCTHLTNATILGNVDIGPYAFGLSAGSIIPLRSVYIAGGTIETYAFYLCTNLTTVTLGDHVTSVGDLAFNEDPISSLFIPPSVRNIGNFAFESSPLTNLVISEGVTNIGAYAFYGSKITSLSIPNSVTFIHNDAFFQTALLTNVIIGANVTNVQQFAFGGCPNLTNVFMLGNAPAVGSPPFLSTFQVSSNVTVYYLPGTTGWSNTLSGAPTVLWNPKIQTTDGHFGISGNQFGFNITGATNLPVVVETCSDLKSHVWTPLMQVTLTNGSFHFSEPAQTNGPGRFYALGIQ